MSDDLVKRLRMVTGFIRFETGDRIAASACLSEQAADRIEELEAKLAKAVEALERIASGEFSGRMLTSMPPQDAAAYFARTTLAKLKEEVRDE